MIVSLSTTKNDVCHGHIQYSSGGRRARLRHRCAQQLVTTVALRDILAGNYVAPAEFDAVAGLRPPWWTMQSLAMGRRTPLYPTLRFPRGSLMRHEADAMMYVDAKTFEVL